MGRCFVATSEAMGVEIREGPRPRRTDAGVHNRRHDVDGTIRGLSKVVAVCPKVLVLSIRETLDLNECTASDI